MSSATSAHEIARDARWLAQALDPNAGLVRLVEMTPESYRAASFLDDRMLQQPVNSQLVPWSLVKRAATEIDRLDARWIFHIGHVGSTLIARLLGELDGVLSVREPRSLRDLTFFPTETRDRFTPGIQALMSRTFGPDQIALVKATSMVSEIAAELVPSDGRALFLYTDPRTYIATMLAGENNSKELEALAGLRASRMAERVHALGGGGGAARLAAEAWACEMTALEAAAAAKADRHLLWANFDMLLVDIEAALDQIARFFGFEAPADRVAEIARGPLMSRYSKALEYDYSPSLRAELIARQLSLGEPEINDALAMLERSAQESPLLARALARARSEP